MDQKAYTQEVGEQAQKVPVVPRMINRPLEASGFRGVWGWGWRGVGVSEIGVRHLSRFYSFLLSFLFQGF